MKDVLNYLYNQKSLDRNQAKDILINIGKGNYNQAQIASFISVYLMRHITVEELSGFRDALLELCLKLDFSDYNTIDMCGTGGDGKDTFNISTLASFVLAGAGIHVAKHGNTSVSSVCGSSDVLSFLGYKFTNKKEVLTKQLEKANICFLHAPLFHPAMKEVAPIRQMLGVKTFFNILGPIVNPCLPKNQVIGVYNLEIARLYNYLFQSTDYNYSIVHSLDGYDEISLTNNFKLITNNSEKIVSPNDFNFEIIKHNEISGGNSVKESANIFISILNNNGSEAQNSVVIINAAIGINCVYKEKSFLECIEMAKESLLSGKAKKSFDILINLN